jgi:hypothetical protein
MTSNANLFPFTLINCALCPHKSGNGGGGAEQKNAHKWKKQLLILLPKAETKISANA